MVFHSSRGEFPTTRMRRLRQQAWTRSLACESSLAPSNLIWPLFVLPDEGCEEPIESLPGVFRRSADLLLPQIEQAIQLGIPAIALFPVTPPELKTEDGREAINPNNLVCTTVRKIRDRFADQIGIICDVALDPYTVHGHDGLLRDGQILNDETLEILQQQAIVQARAGCSVIAPSDMMDGRVARIRSSLDQEGFQKTLIMAYSAKYASAFYGPFRDAVGSKKNLAGGDKKTYQMSPANTDEAVHEAALDLREGADIVMVKPGMPYLDIVRRLRSELAVPTAVYQVSGEYAMICAAAERGWLDLDACMMESLLGFRRAGADMILTYFALEAAKTLQMR
ncbi:MAG: porphobilinogen synthase [bacterium]|nr:porphobilinogen synthase [bacterium]